ncbi:hypothetical protein Bhyg_04734, partial [Pseudolycoriella hygida]
MPETCGKRPSNFGYAETAFSNASNKSLPVTSRTTRGSLIVENLAAPPIGSTEEFASIL